MGSESTRSNRSSESTRSVNSSRSSKSSRFCGQGENVELCQDKYDEIKMVRYYYTKYYPKKEGFILETEPFYYSFKYQNGGITSIRSKDYEKCEAHILQNVSEENYDWDECEFYSSLTLGKIEEIVDDLLSETFKGTIKNFENAFKEKIKEYYNFENRNISYRIDKERFEKINSVWKIVVPYKSRDGVIAGRVFASIFTLGFINISTDLRQNMEHHGLIFDTDRYWYVVNYGSEGIRASRSKASKVCIDEVIDFASNAYDDKTFWPYECDFNSSLDLGDIESYIKSLARTYNENTYHGFLNNCQYFAKNLLYKIGNNYQTYKKNAF